MSYSRKNVPAGNTEYGLSEMFSSYEEEFHQSEAEIRRLLATAGRDILQIFGDDF